MLQSQGFCNAVSSVWKASLWYLMAWTIIVFYVFIQMSSLRIFWYLKTHLFCFPKLLYHLFHIPCFIFFYRTLHLQTCHIWYLSIFCLSCYSHLTPKIVSSGKVGIYVLFSADPQYLHRRINLYLYFCMFQIYF